MSDEVKDPGKLSTEPPVIPKPEFSKEEPKDSPDNLDSVANALIAKLTPEVIKIAKQASQSEKDQGIASAKRDASKALEGVASMRGVVEKFQSYVTAYGSEERAYAEMERDARMDKLESSSSGTSTVSVGAGAKSWEIEQKEILDSVGIGISDQRVLDLAASKKWESEADYLTALKAQTFTWFQGEASKPDPSAATTASTVDSTPSGKGEFPSETSDQLGDRMVGLLANRTANLPEIMKIDAELKRRDVKPA